MSSEVEELVPLLLAAGFEGPRKITGNSLLHEYRRRIPGAVQVLSIQLERNQLPRFLLVFHIEPPEGLARVIADGGTVLTGCLKPKTGAGLKNWFRADRPWWQTALGRTDTLEREAVRLCVALLPEIEAWWSSQKPSPHIDCWPVEYPGTDTGGHLGTARKRTNQRTRP
jgi:hypothetical protein